MILRHIWPIPLLSTLYWGSCVDFASPTAMKEVPQNERDTRAAICAFAGSSIMALIARACVLGAQSKL